MRTFPLVVIYRSNCGTTDRLALDIEAADLVAACRAAEQHVASLPYCAEVLRVDFDGQEHTN